MTLVLEGLSWPVVAPARDHPRMLGDEPCLEVRDGTEDVEHELAGGRGGIEMLLEADQVDAASLEAVDGLEQLAQRASQTVEPGDRLLRHEDGRAGCARSALSGTAAGRRLGDYTAARLATSRQIRQKHERGTANSTFGRKPSVPWPKPVSLRPPFITTNDAMHVSDLESSRLR